MIKEEGPLSLFKGTGAVVSGVTPKVLVRFNAYAYYKSLMPVKEDGTLSNMSNFWSGIMAGVTEAVVIVTPTEVVKVRILRFRFILDILKKTFPSYCLGC